MSIDWVYNLHDATSIDAKKKVVEKAVIASRLGSSSAQCFLYNCYLSHNPFFVYGIEHVPETFGIANAENPWGDFWSILEGLRTNTFGSRTIVKFINEIKYQFCSEEWNLIVRPVFLKQFVPDLCIGEIRKILNNTEWRIPVFSCQIIGDIIGNMRNLTGKKILEPRLRGIRALAMLTNNNVVLYDRGGNLLAGFEEISYELDRNKEIFSVLSNFGSIMLDGVIVNRDEKSNPQFNIFDIIPLSEFVSGNGTIKQSDRRDILKTISRSDSIVSPISHVKVLNGIEVDLDTSEGYNIMKRYANYCVNQGFEEIIVKDFNSIYSPPSSNAWVRYLLD